MPFELPETFAPKEKPLSATSQRIYKGRLNKLSDEGLGDTPAQLKKNAKKGVKFLAEMGDTEKDKAAQRSYLSSVFWVMDEKYKTKKTKPFYKYYQKVLPLKSKDGDWVKRSEYVAEEK